MYTNHQAPRHNTVRFSDPVVDISRRITSCVDCRLRPRCLPEHLSCKTIAGLAAVVKPTRMLSRGSCLFRQGDQATSLYAIRMGSVKGVLGSADGIDQVLGFYFAGDLAGVDSLGAGVYRSSAFVLERTAVCEIVCDPVEVLYEQATEIFHHIVNALAKTLANQECLALGLSKHGAERRLARFLLDLSQRQYARGLAATELRLTMSRYDIANHLGMAPETVSRIFKHFEREGILAVERKTVTINDLEWIRAIAQAAEPGHRDARSARFSIARRH